MPFLHITQDPSQGLHGPEPAGRQVQELGATPPTMIALGKHSIHELVPPVLQFLQRILQATQELGPTPLQVAQNKKQSGQLDALHIQEPLVCFVALEAQDRQ